MATSAIFTSGVGRLVLGAAVLSALTLVPAHAADDLGRAPGGQKPTVVLVHGAFADGSSWNGVVQRLQQDGYQVIAPPNTLRGLPQDSTYLNSLLKTIKGPVVLVGHSYGGEVISQAASGLDNVKALVYVNAIMPDKGESFAGLSAKFPAAPLAKALRQVPFRNGDGTTGTDLYIQPSKLHATFAQDLSRQQASVMAATQRPIAQSAFTDKLTAAAWRDKPVYVLVGTQDRAINPNLERFEAKRAHARKTVEINASHVSLISQPQAVTDLIVSAAHDSGHQ
ncbi:alpha/beta fold hydrolase [Streptomyces fagopyri]|uniref:Alpha/beta fold hydrolase n=1 Tax=Streptomyces fagopyri TaxID=2662397 RepID=A0A5Q0L5B8_9ACTN|nr:alpha/beta hydrolase [Streptomyces fagopyri]QFZ72240.1 alpha/beta fold hydrolase [Streptomyces fagopyri]